jgi:biopolymer transport protein ExbD
MFRRRHSEPVPELNTSSTADISFMLLIFFLVTSSMDTDQGLMRQLPPPPDEQQKPMDVKQDHVLSIRLDADDRLSLDGILLSETQLTEMLMRRIEGDRLEHVVSIETCRETSYEAYFHLQNAVVRAYGSLRDARARQLCGKPYSHLTADEREDIDHYYPQRISEAPPKDETAQQPKEGGGQ